MPVPQKMNMNQRKKRVPVYFSMHEYMELKKKAKTEHMQLSPYLRMCGLTFGNHKYLISAYKASPIERITKKDIENKLTVDPRAKDFKDCMKELREGIKLAPVGSFDQDLIFLEVDEQ